VVHSCHTKGCHGFLISKTKLPGSIFFSYLNPKSSTIQLKKKKKAHQNLGKTTNWQWTADREGFLPLAFRKSVLY
jgi:hypothetical protein